VLVGNFDGDFYSLDLKARAADRAGERFDSSREWKFDGSAWIWARGVIDGNTVYVSTLNGEIFALDLASGRPVWTSPSQIEGQIVGDPVIFSGPRGKSLAVASGEQDVWVIDMATGDDVGKFDTNAGVKASPAITDEFLFVYTLDEELQWFSRGDLARRGCLKMPSGEVCG
jgi:outer membrane protein assembly factor BamB